MSETFDRVDLTNCDREPIHRLGAIQPFGFLLVSSADWLVARASENLEQFIGVSDGNHGRQRQGGSKAKLSDLIHPNHPYDCFCRIGCRR